MPELLIDAITAHNQMTPEVNIPKQQIQVSHPKYRPCAQRLLRFSRSKTGITYKRWKASRLSKRDDK
jgi:hypothetical protein